MLSDSLQAQAQAIADAYQPPPTGRPSAIADMPVVVKLLTAIREGNYLETACQLAGIHKVTVYDWKKRGEAQEEPYKTFSDALEKAAAEAECEAIRNVRQAGKLPQFWAAEMTYLERRHPERWGRRTEGSNEPRVLVQIGVKDSDVQVQVSTISDQVSTLSPPLTPDIHSLTPCNTELSCLRSEVMLTEEKATAGNPPADPGARSAGRLQPGPARLQRRRASRPKSALGGAKEKKGLA